MLNIGGVIVFDDANWLAIRKVCRFVRTNRAYSVLGIEGSDDAPSLMRRVSEYVLRYTPFSKFLRPDVVTPDKSIRLGGRCIAFKKDADDNRSWDHFVDF